MMTITDDIVKSAIQRIHDAGRYVTEANTQWDTGETWVHLRLYENALLEKLELAVMVSVSSTDEGEMVAEIAGKVLVEIRRFVYDDPTTETIPADGLEEIAMRALDRWREQRHPFSQIDIHTYTNEIEFKETHGNAEPHYLSITIPDRMITAAEWEQEYPQAVDFVFSRLMLNW